MPKQLSARPPLDATEERQARKLTHRVHAPADWIFHAQIVASSWDGLRTRQIAQVLGCHPQTVRERVQAFNERSFDGLGMKPGGGRKPRLTEAERRTILHLVQLPPPGKPTYEPPGELPVDDPKGEREWTLDALTAMARNTASYLEFLQTLDHTYPTGDLDLIADNLASHTSGPIREWLEAHPRIQRAFIPVGAAWLNLIEGWWRIFRRKAFAGQSLADDHDSAFVTRIATQHLNRHAQPGVWGRPPKPHRGLRRRFVYYL